MMRWLVKGARMQATERVRGGSSLLLAATVFAVGLACAAPATSKAHPLLRSVSPLPASEYSVKAECARAASGHARCLALALVPESGAARARNHPLGITRSETVPTLATGPEVCLHNRVTENCYGLLPEDLRSAYGLPATTTAAGTQTIALVDAFNDPDAEADLEVYDQALGLRVCSVANSCFRQINQYGETGKPPFPRSLEELKTARKGTASERQRAEEAGGWAGEEALDIETAHALCQYCQILLVEADSSAIADVEAAETAAVRAGASEVSDSWFTGEPEPSFDSPAFDDPGTVITAASGDEGFLNWAASSAAEKGLVNYPASSPHVIAVSGTRLELASPSHARESESTWNGKGPGVEGRGAGGSGCSERFEAPAWQAQLAEWASTGCTSRRAVADLAADADPYTGVAIYDSTPDEGGQVLQWETMGGTSLASPIIAAAFALAGGSHGVEYPAQTLYENAAGASGSLYDIASGSNGQCLKPLGSEGLTGCSVLEEAAGCEATAICLAGAGYDGPTGLGSPNGLGAFEAHGIPERRTQLLEITSAAPGSASVGGTPYTIAASATSGLGVSFSSATPEVCSASGSSVSFAAIGTCTIDANQAGDSEYDAAPEVLQSFVVAVGTQSIQFTSSPPSHATIGGPVYAVSAAASSGLPVTLSSASPSVCAVSGVNVSFNEAGTCTLAARREGDEDYLPAPEARQSFTVARNEQVVEFITAPPTEAVIDGPSYTVTASASSKAQVRLSSMTPTVCVLEGSSVSFIAAGVCTIEAAQNGNSDYEGANAQQSFMVTKKPQLLQFTSSPPQPAMLDVASYLVSASASSGLPVYIVSATPAVCFVTVSIVNFIEAGTCTLLAKQPGDADYEAAPETQQSFTVSPYAPLATPLESHVLSLISSQPPQPNSALTLAGAPSVNRRTGALTFRMSTANPGTLSWRLTFHRTSLFAAGSRQLGAAGSVTVTIAPSRAAATALSRALAHRAGLFVAATLRFQSSLGGAPSSHTEPLEDRPRGTDSAASR